VKSPARIAIAAVIPAVIPAVLAMLWTSPALAHEVLHSVERGRAVAVKAYFADGEPLAYSEYSVFSPTDPKIPYQKGRTDRSGYLAFVPDQPGQWHIRITEAGGHGLEIDVPVATPGAAGDAGAVARSTGIASWAFVLRPLLGVLLVAGLFAALMVIYRKRNS
jgi:nickel transport protein